MPSQIYLVRHGVASWPAWQGADAERPLTAEGARMMEAAAAGLARRVGSCPMSSFTARSCAPA